MDLQSVTPDQVLKVYRGRIGCMCGCKGKYWVHPKRRDEAADERGYAVDEKECSLSQVTRVLRLVQAEGERVEAEADHFYVEVGNTVMCVYLRKATA